MESNFLEKVTEEIIDQKSLERKLKSGKKLRIKLGVDPTSPDIHLGHAVALRILRKFQDEGHKIIFLIGDYTTKIGDPSGRNATRPVLTDGEIKKNAKTYFLQVRKLLDIKKTEVRYNSEWYKKMSFSDILQLAGKFTVAQIIERDDFEKRLKEKRDIGLHETLYPLMQAYDSVILNADVEFGGTDQKFNMLAGRDLQRKMGQEPQDVVMVPLLVGIDGKEKMSKSLKNYIGVAEEPEEMFGKVMSIPDSLIENYFTLCTDESISSIKKHVEAIKKGKNPRDVKADLAGKIVEIYHGKEKAQKAKKEFFKVFSKKELPSKIPEVKISGNYTLPLFLVEIGAIDSTSGARRLILQNAVKIDGARLTDPKSDITPHKGMVVQVGKKKFFKIA